MLFERIRYEDDFPINIQIFTVTDYPYHYHRDVEFIYVLRGTVHLKNVCHHYTLKEGDVYTNSGNEVHGLSSQDPDNIVAMIQVSNRYFTQVFPDLGKACFMTYSQSEQQPKMPPLKKMLLEILLDYSIKRGNYKSLCIDRMIEVLSYINDNYNLFAFEGRTVTNFKESNPVIVNRISRIITYVYENHQQKITLEDIAQREHLSTFYVSHLIKKYIGLNFQEFLCFARVEKSEIVLLETDKKISRVAKEVGFSTTSYFTKYFQKWFQYDPKKYRELFANAVLSTTNNPKLLPLSENNAIKTIRSCMIEENGQDKSITFINQQHYAVDVPGDFDHSEEVPEHLLNVMITLEDIREMGETLYHDLRELNTLHLTLLLQKGDSPSDVHMILNRLQFLGYEVSTAHSSDLTGNISFGYDSIAYGIYVLHQKMARNEPIIPCHLRDQNKSDYILQGAPSCITAQQLSKPSYYAYQLIQYIQGKLIAQGDNYYVICDTTQDRLRYVILVLNYTPSILELCDRNASFHETNEAISSFNDALSIDFSIPCPRGTYLVAKYLLTNDNSLFAYMRDMGFPNHQDTIPHTMLRMLNTSPNSSMTRVQTEESLNVNSSIKGAGVQVIIAQQCD